MVYMVTLVLALNALMCLSSSSSSEQTQLERHETTNEDVAAAEVIIDMLAPSSESQWQQRIIASLHTCIEDQLTNLDQFQAAATTMESGARGKRPFIYRPISELTSNGKAKRPWIYQPVSNTRNKRPSLYGRQPTGTRV